VNADIAMENSWNSRFKKNLKLKERSASKVKDSADAATFLHSEIVLTKQMNLGRSIKINK
jgi:hypothetical protein